MSPTKYRWHFYLDIFVILNLSFTKCIAQMYQNFTSEGLEPFFLTGKSFLLNNLTTDLLEILLARDGETKAFYIF